MPLLRTLLLAFALLFSAPSFAQAGDGGWFYRGTDIAPDPAWRFGTLPNGVRYAVRRNPLPAGQVSIRVRIAAGALHESDAEQGWAHFVEHMAFRGTRSFADREARHIWQQLGASFGSDTNASTGLDQTVYQLDLPKNDRASLDTSFHVLAEMASAALFDPAAVDAERRIILAEKERQPELSRIMGDLSRPLFYHGLKAANRNVIGTNETLRAASAEGLRAFYRRWYRPDRTTVVAVGDADPALLEALIRARFGAWRAEGPPPPEPDYGRIAEPPTRVAATHYAGAPSAATLMWVRPHRGAPHTIAREWEMLEEAVAARIINRRLEARARQEAPFVNASIGTSRSPETGDSTRVSVVARGGRWREALEQSFAIVGDALRAPPSAAEIAREMDNVRSAARAMVEGTSSLRSPYFADRLIEAVADNEVITDPATILAIFERGVPAMGPDRIHAAMRGLFTGSGPRMLLMTPEPVEGGAAAAAAALATAERAQPADRQSDRRVTMADLPPLGLPGREVSRLRIEDMDVTIVTFANGSTLTVKPTQFERGSVSVQLRFGRGMSAIAPDRPSLAWLSGLVAPSGLAGLDLDALERLMTGRRLGISFAIDEDSFVLGGQTSPADLADEMRLLATKIEHPRWDPALFARFQAAALESYDLHLSSAGSRASREFAGLVRPGDSRWRAVEREEMRAASVERMRAFFTPLLQAGPVHAVIVGDVTLEAAVEAARRSVGALPRRPEARLPAGAQSVRPPAPDPAPRSFTHNGDPSQAFAMIGWSTLGGSANIRERRALALAANMFQVRLFERLREAEGASYSPSATHSSSESFADWGIFYASAEVRPQNVPAFFRAAREIVAGLSATAVAPDEFARAQNPVVSGLERRLATNGYWLGAIDDWAERPESIENARRILSDYRSLTAEEVRRAVARFVADAGDWSMVVLPARAAGGGQ